jgi:hypothetical protein
MSFSWYCRQSPCRRTKISRPKTCSSELRPDVAFVDGNPLRLGVEGGYVVKNLVLLAATAALALHSLTPTGPRQRITVSRTPRTRTAGHLPSTRLSAGRQPVGEGPRLAMTINGNREGAL